jgi:hypothetical protein
MLHPSIPDRRCACQGFRRNENLPGALCECGHQACYHASGAMTQPPGEGPLPNVSYMALQDRIHSLESQYQHDKKVWEEELKEERRARREDVRILREAMYPFFKFMDQEVPQKWTDVEDRIEHIVDRQQQLQERLITVDDSTMTLEDRIADLEYGTGLYKAPDGSEDGNDDDDGGDEGEGNHHPQRQVTDHRGSRPSPKPHNDNTGLANLAQERQPANDPEVFPSGGGQNQINGHNVPSMDRTGFPGQPPDRVVMSAKGAPLVPGKLPPLCTDLVFPFVSKAEISIPDCRVRIQSLPPTESSTRSRSYLSLARFGQPLGCSNGIDEDSRRSLSSSPSPSPPRCLPFSSYAARSSNRVQLKRKRSLKERYTSENGIVAGHFLSLPNPPPLSLSDHTDGSRVCKMGTSDVDKSPPSFPRVLSHRVQDCHESDPSDLQAKKVVTPPSEC